MAKQIDPVQLEIYRHLFTSIPEEMGTALKRTAYSPNIKERRDYSCAIFDADGQLAAMGDHMPVHLGSMPLSVQAAISAHALGPGDIVILNDPFCGGTHLPDITMIAPVYEPSDGFSKPSFYTATRAHHSDIGGMSPGSMPLSQEIFQEGLRIPPLKLYRAGQLNRDLLSLLLWNVRTPKEREGDLAAQVGAIRVGEKRLRELLESNGRQKVEQHCAALQSYSEKVMKDVISRIPNGRYQGEDLLDDEGGNRPGSERSIRIRVTITVSGTRLKFDFRGSDAQVKGCMNAVYPITLSAVYYVLRCLAPDDAPASAGLMRPVSVTAEPGTIVNAQYPAATAGGNVETSQRIVDTLLKALSLALPELVPAASSGTMNNLTLGGIDPISGQSFSYYETIAGGMGASPEQDGDSGVHTHMTNSLNTPIEALEHDFPFQVREYRLRNGSGAKGKYRGGDGIIRSLEVFTDCQVTVLSDRRKHPPYGLNGGGAGKRGANYLISKGRRKPLPGKVSINLSKGEAIQIESPGGGGWGARR